MEVDTSSIPSHPACIRSNSIQHCRHLSLNGLDDDDDADADDNGDDNNGPRDDDRNVNYDDHFCLRELVRYGNAKIKLSFASLASSVRQDDRRRRSSTPVRL